MTGDRTITFRWPSTSTTSSWMTDTPIAWDEAWTDTNTVRSNH